MRAAIVAGLLSALVAQNRSTADLAVGHVLRRLQPYLTDARVWRRQSIDDHLDVVFVVGYSEQTRYWPGAPVAPGGAQPVGVFFQERARPDRVYTVGVSSVCGDGQLLRVTATDTVIGCDDEKYAVGPSEKFVYDSRSKRLVKAFSYAPFLFTGAARRRGDGLTFVMSDGTRAVTVDYVPDASPEFRVRSSTPVPPDPEFPAHLYRHRRRPDPSRTPQRFGGAAFETNLVSNDFNAEVEWLVRERATGRRFRLPQSTQAAFAQARPRTAKAIGIATIEEHIGPRAVEGDRLWFGKTFYNGEGWSGVGGVGYFDVPTRAFRLFSSPVIADWSASALHVDPEYVWLATEARGELGGASGGIVRFNRAEQTFTQIDRGRGYGHQFFAFNDRLVLVTDVGVTVIRGGAVQHVIVDVTTDGRLRVVETER